MPSKFLTVKNESGQTPEILVHGPIGRSMWSDEGITGEDFTNALNKFPKGTKVTVGINSQGGSVGEGLAIYNAIERRAADVTARIDGYALSIASFFPQAASRVISPKSSIWMIHRASMWSQGNAAALRKDAEMLDTHDDVICTAYCVRTGKDEQEIKAAMDAETWMSGEQAIAYGLADEDGPDDALDFAPIDATRFTNCPKVFKAVCAVGASAPEAGMSGPFYPMKIKRISPVTNAEGLAGNKPAAASAEILKPMDTQTAPAAVANPPVVENNRIAELEKQLLNERKTRVTAEVKRRGENKIANDKISKWVDRAMLDETVLAEIDEMPIAFEAGKPIIGVSAAVTEVDNVFQRIKKLATAKERHAAAMADWENIYAEACKRDQKAGMIPLAAWDTNQRSLPQNSNTISATITTSFLIDGSVTDLQNVWPVLNAFAMEYSTDPYKPKATGVLKHVTAATATQTNATNFELGDTTVAPVSVTMNQYTQPFNVSSDDMSSGVRLENLRTLNLATFANKVVDILLAPVTTANFAGNAGDNTPLVCSAAAFGFNELAILQGALKKSQIKNLVLDGSYVARIANVPQFFQTAGVVGGETKAWKAFGWDGIFPNSRWDGAGANVQGFANNPQAITGLTGLPLIPPGIPGGIFSQSAFLVPGVGATVMLSAWFNPATRKFWTAYDIMIGVKETDLTAGFILKSA